MRTLKLVVLPVGYAFAALYCGFLIAIAGALILAEWIGRKCTGREPAWSQDF